MFTNKKLPADELAAYRQDLDSATSRSSLAGYREQARQRAEKAAQEKEDDLRKADQRAARGEIMARNRYRHEYLRHPHRRGYVLWRQLNRMNNIENHNAAEKRLAKEEAADKEREAEQLRRDIKELEAALQPISQAAIQLEYEQDRSFAVTFQQALSAMPAAARTLARTKEADLQSEAANRIEDAFSEVTETLARRDPGFTAMALTHFQPGLRTGLSHQSVKTLAVYVADAWKAAKSSSEVESSLGPDAVRASDYWLAEAKVIEPADKQEAKPAAAAEEPPRRGERPRGNRPAKRRQQ
jgi:hypothetical protein